MKKVFFVSLLVGVITLFPSSACAYFFVDQSYAQQIGLSYSLQIENYYGVSLDSGFNAKLNSIGNKLLTVNPSKEPVAFKVLRQNAFNAFSVPGGHIYVTSTLMSALVSQGSDHELAFVLGHELGHENCEHFLKQTDRLMTASLIVTAAIRDNEDLRNKVMTLASVSITRGFGFDKEHEADHYSFNTITAAGFNPGAGIAFFNRLEALSSGQTKDAVANFVNPHPKTATRIQKQMGYLSDYSGGIVKIDDSGCGISINNVPVIHIQSRNALLNRVRTAYIAGNLAMAAHDKTLANIHYENNSLMCADRTIMILGEDDEPADSILSAFSLALLK